MVSAGVLLLDDDFSTTKIVCLKMNTGNKAMSLILALKVLLNPNRSYLKIYMNIIELDFDSNVFSIVYTGWLN